MLESPGQRLAQAEYAGGPFRPSRGGEGEGVGVSDTDVTLLSGIVIVLGVLGVIIPVLPGLLLCWLGVLGWAIFADGGWSKWLVLGVASAIAFIGTVVKYAWPGRRLKRTGVSSWSMFFGGLLALIGFFVVPVVGLVLGFLLGIFLSERVRAGNSRQAWRSTVHALKAAGLSLLIELGAALFIAGVWVAGLVLA